VRVGKFFLILFFIYFLNLKKKKKKKTNNLFIKEVQLFPGNVTIWNW